jgi:alpha-beta hydrolase superfamily lysophospholipase
MRRLTAVTLRLAAPLGLLGVLALLVPVPGVATAGVRTAAPAAPQQAQGLPPLTSPGGTPFVLTRGTLDVKDGPDGTHAATIEYTLRVPATATAATPAPAIIMTHGFGYDRDSDEVLANASFLSSHGYVTLTWSAQGFGKSTGCVRLDSLDYDIKDAQQLMDLLQKRTDTRKDSTGLVAGIVGGSYGGGPDLLLASVDRRIRATVPGRTWNTLRFSLDPNNYFAPGKEFDHLANAQGFFKQEWTSLFFASGNSNPVAGKGTCPQEKLASGEPLSIASTPCAGFPLAVCQAYADLTADGDASDETKALLERSGPADHLAAVSAPTLLVQGQSDTLFTENDALATYTALRRQGVPVAMIWNDGGHGGYSSKPGECEVYDGRSRTATDLDTCYLPRRTLAWFDRFVRGAAVDTGPGFAWYEDWRPSSVTNPPYGSADTYPAAAMTRYTLSGSAALVPPGAPATVGSASLLNPAGGQPAAYTETPNFTGPDASQGSGQKDANGNDPYVLPIPGGAAPPSEQPGQNAGFTAPAFTTDTDVVGTARLHVQLAHVAPTDAFLLTKVYDVSPDGSATLVRRLVAASRIPSAALGAPVDLDLPGLAHRFATGHRLRVVLASTDASYRNNPVADTITVTTGPSGILEVPILTAKAREAIAAQGKGTEKVGRRPARTPRVKRPTGSLAATGGPAALAVTGVALLTGAAALRRRPSARA